MKLTREDKIKDKLVQNDNLTKTQVKYVKQYIEPKYDNECDNCRTNVLMYFGLSYEEACDFVNSTEVKSSAYIPYREDEAIED